MNNNELIFPVIAIEKNTHFEIWNSKEDFENWNTLAYYKKIHEKYDIYDKYGNLWIISNIETTYKPSLLDKILSYIIWSKEIKVSSTFTKLKTYELNILKKEIINYIKKCDDVYTQYNEENKLCNLIEKSINYEELYNNIKKYIFEENYI